MGQPRSATGTTPPTWTTATAAWERSADGQAGTLPSRHGTAKAAWVNGTDPRGAGISVQVAINDVARSFVGHKREDHIPIVDLLEAAKFL
jgi:hypothetical protein